MQPRRWMDERWGAMRSAASRGATLVEYALVFSLLVVVSLVAVEFLTESASNEVENQAQCISDRPPPDADCAFAPAPEGLEFPDPGFSPPFSAPPLPEGIPVLATESPRSEFSPGWNVVLPVSVSEPEVDGFSAGGIPMVIVRAAVEHRFEPGGGWTPGPASPECITDSEGLCEIWYEPPLVDVEAVRIRVTAVEYNPPPASLPTTWQVEVRP